MTKEKIKTLIESGKIIDEHDNRLQGVYYPREVYNKALEDLLKEVEKLETGKSDSCPTCGADLPPGHPLRK